VTESWGVVPFIWTDFTEDALRFPRLAWRTMVQVKVDPPLHELSRGSAKTVVLAGKDPGEKEVMSAISEAIITTPTPAKTILLLPKPDSPLGAGSNPRLLWVALRWK